MPLKLPYLGFPFKIHKLSYMSANLSLISCAQQEQRCQFFPTSTTESLKDELSPKNLLKVLDSKNDLGSVVNTFNWASLQNHSPYGAKTYCSILTKLGLSGYICGAKCSCKEMVGEECLDVDDVLACLVHLFFTRHKVNVSILVLEAMIFGCCKPTLDICNLLMDAILCSNKDFQSVFLIYKEMVKAGVVPSVNTLNCLIDALFRMGKIQYAIRQFETMKRKGCCPNGRTFKIIISALLERNLVDKATETLYKMLEAKCEADAGFYAGIIPLFCQVNKMDEVMKLFKMMDVSNVSCCLTVYNDVIKHLLRSLKLDDAVALVEVMIRRGLEVSVDLLAEIVKGFCIMQRFTEAKVFLDHKITYESLPYNSLLSGYCNSGNIAMAECLFFEMVERRIADIESCNAIMTLYFESGVFGKAYQILARMIISSLIPDAGTYSALVAGKCKVNDWEGSTDLTCYVISRNWVLGSSSYVKLVNCLCNAGKMEQAVDVFFYMTNKGCYLPSSELNLLVHGLCASGKLNKAIGLLRWVDYSYMSSTTYDIIMHHLSMERREMDIAVLLSRMLIGGYAPSVDTYWILIMSMSRQLEGNKCALFFNMMIDGCSLPDSRRILHVFMCLSSHHQLHAVFPAIEKLGTQGALDSAVYNLLINGIWKEGYEREARGLLNLMLEKGWVPDSSTHQLLMGSGVKEGQDGDVEDEISDILADGLGEI